jgi:hypothetical protein
MDKRKAELTMCIEKFLDTKMMLELTIGELGKTFTAFLDL